MDFNYDRLKQKFELEDGRRFLARCKEEYDANFKDKPITTLDYSKFKLIYKTGNRSLYQREYLERRDRLTLLQVLALSDDKYLEDLEYVLAAICDEFTWIWPAHFLKDKEKGEFDYTIVDLYSAQTALFVSETLALFEEKLSFDIKYRIKTAVKTKVLDNFESRTFWWETKFGTNWTSVCGGSVGAAYLYVCPERFAIVKDRLFELMEDYLRGIHEDGVCEEGPSYWAYGFGFFCVFADAYKDAFNETPSFLQGEKIQKTLNYYQHSILGGKFIQIGDQNNEDVKNYSVYELIIKRLFPNDFKLAEYDFAGKCQFDSKAFATRVLDAVGKYDGEQRRGKGAENFSVYYDASEIFLFSNENYAMSVKGGHNREMHNHNDIGAFTVIKNGKKIISDYGSGEYTWEYFNDPVARYGEKIFVCGSLSHSVPVIDGGYQLFGREYKAEYISSTANSVEFNIAKAYGIFDDKLFAKYTCEKDAVKVNYSYSGKKRQITFRFLSDCQPTVDGDKAIIEGCSLSTDYKCEKIQVEKHVFKGHNCTEECAYTIDFVCSPSETFTCEFNLKMS